jgi:hypothetical protein
MQDEARETKLNLGKQAENPEIQHLKSIKTPFRLKSVRLVRFYKEKCLKGLQEIMKSL